MWKSWIYISGQICVYKSEYSPGKFEGCLKKKSLVQGLFRVEVFYQKEDTIAKGGPSKQKTHNTFPKVSIIHQNVQSMGNSIDKIKELLNDISNCFILCITEHWKSQQQLCQMALKNFNLAASTCRKTGKHGGSATYISNCFRTIECKNISDLSVIGEFECSAAEFVINKSKVMVCLFIGHTVKTLRNFSI